MSQAVIQDKIINANSALVRVVKDKTQQDQISQKKGPRYEKDSMICFQIRPGVNSSKGSSLGFID